MNASKSVQPTVLRGVRYILAGLTVLGMVGLVLTSMLGFEEPPHAPMLWMSSAMMLAVPITALVHLGLTRGLTHDEKRIWLNEFRSAQVWSALSEYLSSTNLRESAKRRAQNAVARHKSTLT